MTTLGVQLISLAQHAEAKPLFEQALSVKGECALSEEGRAETLTDLADSLYGLGDFSAAAKVSREAMAIYEKMSKQPSMGVATCLCQLGNIRLAEKDLSGAEPSLRRALAVGEKCAGARSYPVGRAAGLLGTIYYSQNKFDQAIPLCRKALASYDRQAPELANCPAVARISFELANIYSARKNYAEAEPLYKSAIKIYGQSELDPQQYLSVYRSYETLLRSADRGAEADEIARQAKTLKAGRK